MLKFSNEDYSVPRERMGFQRGGSYIMNQRTESDKFRCDGTRRTEQSGCGGIELPASCNNSASLASVYCPYQEYRELFDCNTALCNGTLFRELYKPLKGGRCNG